LFQVLQDGDNVYAGCNHVDTPMEDRMYPDNFPTKKYLAVLFLCVFILGLIGCVPVEETLDAGLSSINRGQMGAEDPVNEDINILGAIQVTDSVVVPPKTGEPTCLQAYLTVRDLIRLGSGEPVIVHFLLKNNAQIPLYLLKWYTPLEGIAGDIFEVTRDGQEIPYMGILASRGNPTPESYIFLEAGESVTAEVDISKVYDFSKPGKYTIKFRSPRISHIAKSEGELAKTLDDLGPVNIPSNEVTLDVVGSSTGVDLPTLGYLSITPENDGLSLVLDVNPHLQAAIRENLLMNE
jgi:hypothetical protein